MTQTREEMIAEAMPLIPIAARKLRIPPGLNIDDLESSGNEAVFEAAIRFDSKSGTPWKKYAYHYVKGAMRNMIALHRRHPARTLQPVVDGQELPPPIDYKANDPAEIAEVRELVRRPRQKLSVKHIESCLPSPTQVADQVTKLRTAMFGSISEDDVAEVMQAVLRKAKAGDMRAATMLTDLLAPGRSGVTVHQQAVVIRSGDFE